MVQRTNGEAVVYEAPEMVSTVIAVENGFAASPFDEAMFGIDNFEDGVEF